MGTRDKDYRRRIFLILLLGVSALFICPRCPSRSAPQLHSPGWRRWGGCTPGWSWSLHMVPAWADPPACHCRMEYEDEVLRKMVPAAPRRPVRGESEHCSSGGSGPAQGPVCGEGDATWRLAESLEHSRTWVGSSSRPFSHLFLLWGDGAWSQCLGLEEDWPLCRQQGHKTVCVSTNRVFFPAMSEEHGAVVRCWDIGWSSTPKAFGSLSLVNPFSDLGGSGVLAVVPI